MNTYKKGDAFNSVRAKGERGLEYTLFIVNKIPFCNNLYATKIVTRVTNPNFLSQSNIKVVNGDAIAEWVANEVNQGYPVQYSPADRLITIDINENSEQLLHQTT